MTHDCRRVRSHRRYDATPLRCWINLFRLVETIAKLRIPYTSATQLNSTVESRRRRRCVLGFNHFHQMWLHQFCRCISLFLFLVFLFYRNASYRYWLSSCPNELNSRRKETEACRAKILCNSFCFLKNTTNRAHKSADKDI